MKKLYYIIKKEFVDFFNTPIAIVFIIIFILLSGVFTFKLSNFYARGRADLQPFFFWHPWLYLILLPALSMREWAEERRSGTIELLLTLPITVAETVIGKFIATWLFSGIVLILTFPIIITVCYLGSPDLGVILAGYIGSFLLAGAYLSIGSIFSALTKNQVISFILTVVLCLIFNLIGFYPFVSLLSNYLPTAVVENITYFSFLSHFDAIQRGVIELKDICFYMSTIVVSLLITITIIENKKGS